MARISLLAAARVSLKTGPSGPRPVLDVAEAEVITAETVGKLKMNRTCMASTLLTVAANLYTAATPAQAKNRCEADLSRVTNDFCIGDQYLKGSPDTPNASLNYAWKLNDGFFDLTSKVCLTTGGTVGARRDMILALDRSQSIWSATKHPRLAL